MRKKWTVRLATAVVAAAMAVCMGGCASDTMKDALMELYEKEEKKDKGSEKEDSQTEDSQAEEPVKESQTAADSVQKAPPSLNAESTQAESAPAGSAGIYSDFIRSQLIPQLGTATNESFSYGFEGHSEGGYFHATPKRASLSDGIIGTYQRDLNKDGLDELIVLYMEGSLGRGSGQNNLWVKVYGENNGAVVEKGSLSFDNCFSGSNGEEYLIGLKDIGNKKLLYATGTDSVYTWADGKHAEIYLYQYDGNSFNEIFQASDDGTDEVWWDVWKNQLWSFGFDMVSNRWGWDGCTLPGESGFEILAYGECTTIEPGSAGAGYQENMVKNGQIKGGIYGSGSSILQQMNQQMAAYGSGSGGSYSSGSYSSAGDYILPQSSSTYLTRQDLAGLTSEQLRIARNEIYARHGRKFQSPELQNYFNSKSWYIGTIEPNQFKDDYYLNVYEKENIKLIQSLEK